MKPFFIIISLIGAISIALAFFIGWGEPLSMALFAVGLCCLIVPLLAYLKSRGAQARKDVAERPFGGDSYLKSESAIRYSGRERISSGRRDFGRSSHASHIHPAFIGGAAGASSDGGGGFSGGFSGGDGGGGGAAAACKYAP